MISKLSSIPLFSTLSQSHLSLLSRQIKTQKVTKSTLILSEGESSDSLYIVNKGKVKIFISGNEGKVMHLRTLVSGDYFGELSLLDQKPRSASVMAETDCELSIITSEDFLKCLSSNQEIPLIMLKVLAGRLRTATEIQKGLALMDVYGRLRMTLISSARIVKGNLTIEPRPRQQDLADSIGASREMVSRLIKDLKRLGYLEITKYSIILKNELPIKL